MWPDDYIEWAKNLKPTLVKLVTDSLEHQAGNGVLREAVDELTKKAVRRAFDRAGQLCRYPGLFADRPMFREWLIGIANREALARFVSHELVLTRLNV